MTPSDSAGGPAAPAAEPALLHLADGGRFVDLVDRISDGKEVFFHYVRTVGDVMTSGVQCLTLDHKVEDALKFFKTHGVRHIPIIDEDQPVRGATAPQPGKKVLVGLVTESDILRMLSFGFGTVLETDEDPKVLKQPLVSVVRRKQPTVAPDAAIFDVVRIMSEDKVDCILVAVGSERGEQQLVGTFTTHDAIRCLLRLEVIRKAREARESRPRSARLIDFRRGPETNQPVDVLFESLLGRVSDIMQENVVSLSLDDPFQRAIELMQEHGICHLPVLDTSGRLKGILSERDVLRFLPPSPEVLGAAARVVPRPGVALRDPFRLPEKHEATRKALNEKVVVAMAGNPVVVEPTTPTVKVADIFCSRKPECVAVGIPNDKGITGIVTENDFLNAILALGNLLSGKQ